MVQSTFLDAIDIHLPIQLYNSRWTQIWKYITARDFYSEIRNSFGLHLDPHSTLQFTIFAPHPLK